MAKKKIARSPVHYEVRVAPLQHLDAFWIHTDDGRWIRVVSSIRPAQSGPAVTS